MPENDAESELEIVCPRCNYRMPRTPERLRRETEILCPNCGATIVPPGEADETASDK